MAIVDKVEAESREPPREADPVPRLILRIRASLGTIDARIKPEKRNL